MSHSDNNAVMVGSRKDLPQIFVSEVDEKGSLRHRQAAIDDPEVESLERKIRYEAGTTSTPNNNMRSMHFLQPPPAPHHDSPPRKKSKDEFGMSFSSPGDSGYQESENSFRGYGKRSQLPGLDGSVWSTSSSSPMEDLKRKMKGRVSFTDDTFPWTDVSKQEIIQSVCLLVMMASIGFGFVAFSHHFESRPLEASYSQGKYRSIEITGQMWRKKMADEGRVVGKDIVDEDGNVLLGGKKAAMQFAHDLNVKAEAIRRGKRAVGPEYEAIIEEEVIGRQEGLFGGVEMGDLSKGSSVKMKDSFKADKTDEVKSIEELTEEIRQIADMLKYRDSELELEEVQTFEDYDEVLRNQLEEKDRKKKRLLEKINASPNFSSVKITPPDSANKQPVIEDFDELTNEGLDGFKFEDELVDIELEDMDSEELISEDLDGDVEDEWEGDIEDDEENLLPLEEEIVKDDQIDVEMTNRNKVLNNKESKILDQDTNKRTKDLNQVKNEKVEDDDEEQLKRLLDEVKIKTREIEEKKAIKSKGKSSKKKTKKKNPLKEVANRNKKVTKAVKPKIKASNKSSKILDQDKDKDKEKLKGDEMVDTKKIPKDVKAAKNN